MKLSDFNPLVSIVVITYNSARYVLETLESAKAQTYENIELIVSDDASTDNTAEICRQWIEDNKQRFLSAKLIIVPENNGISANCNRGVKASQGKWIKLIAGDDILLPNCIMDYIIFIRNSEENPALLHSNYYYFHNNDGNREFVEVDKSTDYFNSPDITSNIQLKLIYRDVYIGAPTVFFKSWLWEQLSGFDEDMPYEDWPFYIKSLNFGQKIYFVPLFLVLYRIHDNSIFNYNLNGTIFNNFYKKDRVIYQKLRKQKLSFPERINEDFLYYSKIFFDAFKFNRKSVFFIKLYDFILWIYNNNKRLFSYFLLLRLESKAKFD